MPNEKLTKKQILDAYQELLAKVDTQGVKDESSLSVKADKAALPILPEIIGKLESFQALIVEGVAVFNKQVANFQAELARQQEQLTREIQTKRDGWRREAEEYAYRIKVERQQAEDEYRLKTKDREREFAESIRLRQQKLDERERALKEAEEELKTLRLAMEQAPAELAQATEAAAKQARAEVEQKARMDAELTGKDQERERAVAKLTIAGLEQALQLKTEQIASLERQLAQAVGQAQRLAVSVIEAGGRKSSDSEIKTRLMPIEETASAR
ncbi:hypothetical protein HYW32_02725 [Candidatus Berkelbacteria bacterium]|nr:hypothetical protein [Candidatus Berkelbacteria bacterium]